MAAIFPFYRKMDIDPHLLSKHEIFLLEARLFQSICYELLSSAAIECSDQFLNLTFDYKMEKNVLDAKFVSWLVNDILKTGEYNIEGLARYTDTPADVIFDLAGGLHSRPGFHLCMRIIELHLCVRPELYGQIFSKILSKFHTAA